MLYFMIIILLTLSMHPYFIIRSYLITFVYTLPTFLIKCSFIIPQSIGDGGQGWCNAILYIFWNRKICERLIMNPFRMIYLHVGEYVLHSGSASHNTTFAIRSCTNDSGPSVWKTSTQWHDRDGEERGSRFLFEEAAAETSSVNLT